MTTIEAQPLAHSAWVALPDQSGWSARDCTDCAGTGSTGTGVSYSFMCTTCEGFGRVYTAPAPRRIIFPGAPTQVEQNRAHRLDPIWAKVGRSEYLRSDGVTIRKDLHRSTTWWRVCLPSGEVSQFPFGDQFSPVSPASAPSLTLAKELAAKITADSPAYIRGGVR